MTEFLKNSDEAKSHLCLHKELKEYVLKEFIPFIDYGAHNYAGNEAKLIEFLFPLAFRKLKIYETAQELAENVDIFKNFPGNWRFFKTELEPYQTSPIVYESLNREKFIYKSDIFPIIQNMVAKLRPDAPLTIIACFLKSLEKNMENVTEFVKIDEEFLRKFYEELERGIQENMQIKEPALVENVKSKKVKKFRKFKCRLALRRFKIQKYRLRRHRNQPSSTKNLAKTFKFHRFRTSRIVRKFQSLTARDDDESFIGKLGVTEDPEQLAELYTCTEPIIRAIEGLVKSHPAIFAPRAVDSTDPIAVRLFEDGDLKFVLRSELSNALLLNATIAAPWVEPDRGSWTLDECLFTMSWQEVWRNGYDRRIKLIRTPILRARHRAVPVHGPTPIRQHDFFVLAIDAFFEFFRDLIYGRQFFQKYAFGPNCSEFFKRILEEYFYADEEAPFFIRIQPKNIHLPNLVSSLCHGHFRNSLDLRTVHGEFTLDTLDKELKHLGLDTTFPDIFEVSVDVFNKMNEIGKISKASDFYQAIECCQMICVLRRVENLKKFVHNQNGCHRIYGLECDACTLAFQERETFRVQKILENLSTLIKDFSHRFYVICDAYFPHY